MEIVPRVTVALDALVEEISTPVKGCMYSDGGLKVRAGTHVFLQRADHESHGDPGGALERRGFPRHGGQDWLRRSVNEEVGSDKGPASPKGQTDAHPIRLVDVGDQVHADAEVEGGSAPAVGFE